MLNVTLSKSLLLNFYKMKYCFLNGPTPASFSFIFGLFKQTLQFLLLINVKNVKSIQYKAPGFELTTSQS